MITFFFGGGDRERLKVNNFSSYHFSKISLVLYIYIYIYRGTTNFNNWYSGNFFRQNYEQAFEWQAITWLIQFKSHLRGWIWVSIGRWFYRDNERCIISVSGVYYWIVIWWPLLDQIRHVSEIKARWNSL